ncbi:RNA polymerase sigma factor (sigma-70 family) [Salirhabdus euzebyi]|uniref:RNA polymerase sigma factor (Sigma-70 family) n=1 Tax=Salirhabdus euzebyi TaxID=394506 RepID=A0A841Q7K5_9BACI|nr:sigma-70 family RNA polymerase sigma factor [Salirhabdus euzebyi]MBB6454559.1 RNA polymerase sigma factor (sigma-70 family) [Salirhabdus euzebyi]
MVEVKKQPFNDVLKEYDRIIYHLIHRLGIRDPYREFYQEGVIALWKAYETYDEDKGGKFSTYAYFRIEKALLSSIRDQNRRQEKEEKYKQIMFTFENLVTTDEYDLIDMYTLEKIKAALSEKQLIWFTSFVLNDLSVKEIAENEGVTVDAVKNWARLAKPKIRKLLHVN